MCGLKPLKRLANHDNDVMMMYPQAIQGKPIPIGADQQ